MTEASSELWWQHPSIHSFIHPFHQQSTVTITIEVQAHTKALPIRTSLFHVCFLFSRALNLHFNHTVYHTVKPTFSATHNDAHSWYWLFIIKFTQLKTPLHWGGGGGLFTPVRLLGLLLTSVHYFWGFLNFIIYFYVKFTHHSHPTLHGFILLPQGLLAVYGDQKTHLVL